MAKMEHSEKVLQVSKKKVCDNLLVLRGPIALTDKESDDKAPSANQNTAEDSSDKKKKGHLTFERNIEILKVLATIWVAGIGTFVTMQFNERQHELNRIQAIASMLPHLSEKTDSGPSSASPDNPAPSQGQKKADMSRDGAIWAIYRTANSKTMLRDLASLFPEDIYRVVSSTAVSGGLEEDEDAMTALEVASEKLAAKYSQEKKTDMAIRLYDQALRLRARGKEKTPFISLTSRIVKSMINRTAMRQLVWLLQSTSSVTYI